MTFGRAVKTRSRACQSTLNIVHYFRAKQCLARGKGPWIILSGSAPCQALCYVEKHLAAAALLDERYVALQFLLDGRIH